MKEIKFRAWDEDGFMFQPTSIEFHPDGTIRVWHNKETFGDLGSAIISLMQATSIKDSQGKDIYEGDIVQSGKTNFIIQWERYTASYEAWDYRAWAAGFYDAYIPMKDISAIVPADCEPPCVPDAKFHSAVVIGNIYENPELCPEIKD